MMVGRLFLLLLGVSLVCGFGPQRVHVATSTYHRSRAPALQYAPQQQPGSAPVAAAALPAQGSSDSRRFREVPWHLVRTYVVRPLLRTDTSLLCGLLAGFISFHAFPLVERVIRLWALLPMGAKGTVLGSGFTTDVWGAFCPAVGILFATLISSTVDKLWARQEALRKDLVAEAALLAELTQLLDQADQADEEVAWRLIKESEMAAANAAISVSSPADEVDASEPPESSAVGSDVSPTAQATSNPIREAAGWIQQLLLLPIVPHHDSPAHIVPVHLF